MEININKFCRSLTPAEKEQYSEFGKCENLFFTSPLLSWLQPGNLNYANEIRLYILPEFSLFEAPMSRYITKKECVAVAVLTAAGIEQLFFFEIDKASEALEFYNKMLEALKNNNNY